MRLLSASGTHHERALLIGRWGSRRHEFCGLGYNCRAPIIVAHDA